MNKYDLKFYYNEKEDEVISENDFLQLDEEEQDNYKLLIDGYSVWDCMDDIVDDFIELCNINIIDYTMECIIKNNLNYAGIYEDLEKYNNYYEVGGYIVEIW